MGGGRDYSEKTSEEVDAYIKAKLSERYEAVKAKLEFYREAMETMTAVLLDVEVIEKEKVEEIIKDFEEKNGIIRESNEEELHSDESHVKNG